MKCSQGSPAVLPSRLAVKRAAFGFPIAGGIVAEIGFGSLY